MMRVKGQIRELLMKGDTGTVASLAGGSPGSMRELRTLLLETDDLLRWRAIHAIGKVMGGKAASNLAGVRDEVRRLLWAMSDESGNFLPHAPEAIGEILANVLSLVEEFAAVLVSFLREEPFERGVHWAIARISQIAPLSLTPFSSSLADSLGHPDPFVRAHAVLVLRAVGNRAAERRIEELARDDSTFTVYDSRTGEMLTLTVGKAASG